VKIAIATDEGKTVSRHFGQARYYLVAMVENGQVAARELREKPSHQHFANEPHAEPPSQPHGFGPAEENRHARMAEVIKDCQVLLCGGMGRGAYESMKAQGIRPIVTDIASIDEAVAAWAQGKLVDHTDRLH
jgi:predicted Fe-Mo cluster-binding NifX family protein